MHYRWLIEAAAAVTRFFRIAIALTVNVGVDSMLLLLLLSVQARSCSGELQKIWTACVGEA